MTDSWADLRDSYKSGLYLFGFIKVVKGRKLEKALWAVIMLLIISFTSYMVYKNTIRYAAYGVRTKTLSEEMPERVLPVITFCLQSTFYRNMNCYNNKTLDLSYPSCDKTISIGPRMRFQDGYRSGKWINGRTLGNNCHVLNANQMIKLSAGKEGQEVIFDPPFDPKERIVMILQSKEEFENREEYMYISQYSPLLKFGIGAYQINIREKHTKSLPAPYISNCTNSNVVSNIFSKRYTYRSCRETCAYKNMYNECGDTIDIWKKYNTRGTHPYNKSKYYSRRECIKELMNQALMKVIPNCECNSACEESEYTTSERYYPRLNGLFFEFLNKDAVFRVDIVPDYTLEQFVGALGGILGLGGKLMSSLQLLIFLSLCVVHLINK